MGEGMFEFMMMGKTIDVNVGQNIVCTKFLAFDFTLS